MLAAQQPPSSAPSLKRIATPGTCAALEREYRERVHDLAACSVDQDCTIEARGGVWFGLDGCYRPRASKAVMAEADAMAERWLALGCAQDFEICLPAGDVACRWNHCAELPPQHVPGDWKRVDMGRAVTFYVPPEMVEQPARGEDSVVRALASPQVAVMADLGAWSNPLKFDRHPTPESDNPEWALMNEQEIVAGGTRAVRVAARNLWASWCADGGTGCVSGWRFTISMHVPEIPYRGQPNLALLDHPKLTIVVSCQVFADCLVADRIFASVTFW